MVIDMKLLSVVERQNYLQHAIAPRPVCFASTISNSGQVNLSPFSFFNLFSVNPPIVIFSPSRRARDGTTKHTLQNVLEIPEVVINIVDTEMVQQVSLASCEYDKGVNEFIKAGFTPEQASTVKPPMVKESKVKLECSVQEIMPLGREGGAGNLVICEVLHMHINDNILNERQMIDQKKLHHVARLGGDWYCRVDESNLFIVEKPNMKTGIGIDNLPDNVKQSRVFTGNHLGMLANVHQQPVADPAFDDAQVRSIVQYYSLNPEEMEIELYRYSCKLLDAGKIEDAWQVVLFAQS
jgi:flavin reductase (DIM6/NTAB) family NADH-FMN oxidoreductase RutF